MRAATQGGLVALDPQGEVVPAIADRWNVTEGGRIFVFRLRDGSWPDGSEMTAESVRQALTKAIRNLRGSSLGLDLARIDEVRAMAGRVVEIRLSSEMPDLLQLLAQPELSLSNPGGGTGAMNLVRDDDGAVLSLKSPPERGLPMTEDWRDYVRDVHIHALGAQEAIDRFEAGEIEVVLGGRIGSLPLADTGPLSRGTVRLDPTIGLFGLQVRRARGVLETPELREAIAMAIDRPALASRFNIGGWVPTTRVVAPGLLNDPGYIQERWTDNSIDELRQTAAGRIARWRAAQGGEADAEDLTVSLQIGDDPGLAILFDELKSQLARIGVALVRAESGEEADLSLIDRVARYGAPLWFLNQFSCSLDRGLCSEDADFLVAEALDEQDAAQRSRLLSDAEAGLQFANVYIPFGSPVRWSLVRGNVDGFMANRWGFHPLPDMAVIPR
ncbi:peptide ABC transporter substrate-binding protein [Altererythrobacter aestuarii]|uniref:Peptide ABC transporter substrate-binding protein n=1 Tax=Alteraurantiacibacter aestuarii TaxID=650004 RepID=A0A844ZND2_9SPHN|nr:peptide ABC transporter substrate-binding protein [Alteraurantiacibacter aestuarii]